MSIKTSCTETAKILRTVTELKRVYSIGDTGSNAIPDAIGDEIPSAIVYPSESVSYQQGPGASQRHEYNLKIQVFVSGSDTGSKANLAVDIFDAIKVAFQQATALNDANGVNTVARIASWRFGALSYSEQTFMGWEITLFISEDDSINYGR